MGYLLKEALKTLCGVNQWSYAVFWKIGYQNPKLLIWEECYYEPIMYGGQPGSSGVQNSEMGFEDWISAEACDPQLGIRAGNGIHLLVNKMMMDNHVNVLGEGLVGRAAFTGSHQWILLENCRRDAHPPEVLKEVCQQFSAGMQTIVVIPVLPHGVVQLGSHMPIMENVAFVNDVKTLVLQLGCVPGVLLSENYSTKEPVPPKIGVPVCTGNSFTVNCSETSLVYNSTPFNAEICDYKSNLTQTAAFVGQTSCSIGQDPEVKHSAAAMFRASDLVGQNPVASHDDQCQAKIDMSANKQCPSTSQLANGVAKAEVISSNPEVWLNQQTSVCIPRSTFDRQTPIGLLDINGNGDKFVAQQISSNIGSQGNMNRGFNVTVVNHSSACNLQTTSSVTEYPSADNKFIGIDLVDVNGRLDNCFNQALGVQIYKQDEITSLSECIPGLDQKDKKHDYGVQNLSLGDACAPHRSGDDLFDILGVDFRNKLLNCSWDNVQNSVCDSNITQLDKNNSTLLKGSDASTDLYPINQGLSDSSIFSVTSADHLLDAVISSIHPSEKQNLDDTMSCRTTLTTTSSSSVPNASRSCSRVGASGQLQGDLFSFPKSLAKSGSLSSCSFRSGPGKDNKASYSNSGSLYGSQISSWIEHQDVKPSSSVSTAYSKKPDEVSKTNRKRLKPGENPRPRPKDRQMIQDRVKELREIVPNGAKCSIDALLERTIKHMLFLQSVTKHADKLKQTGDSKIIGKEGGLLTKDNYDGGATWAYEVGSQSLVCPIIVEDLNQPRQMLVEMLCEERGLFLEIADIIRGLGLTILKGVMETRNDKIWARFAVEANRDVTRMEIFISLVRLLEQTAKNGVLPTNCIDNDSMMVHQFQQATSIPASGRPCDLQ